MLIILLLPRSLYCSHETPDLHHRATYAGLSSRTESPMTDEQLHTKHRMRKSDPRAVCSQEQSDIFNSVFFSSSSHEECCYLICRVHLTNSLAVSWTFYRSTCHFLLWFLCCYIFYKLMSVFALSFSSLFVRK